MRLSIVHLSDIHFRASGNPLFAVVDQIAQAAYSADPSATAILLIVSGDIAFSGKTEEYEVAVNFFNQLKDELQKLCPNAAIKYFIVPGNHDCLLPEKSTKLRETLIRGFVSSIQDGEKDQALLEELLKAQNPYSSFRDKLDSTNTWDGLCGTACLDFDGSIIQINLYNTALLSQRAETQGKLQLPLDHYGSSISLVKNAALSISVFHHSYIWIESNEAMAFRAHIERTSDVALSGHQHYPHDFYKENSTGETILYLEGAALQDENYAKTSGFQVLVFDLDTFHQKSVRFRRSRDLYRVIDETNWRKFSVNRVIRSEFRLNPKFDEFLNTPGTPLYHNIKGYLKLRDIFVYPDISVRPAGHKTNRRDIHGNEFSSYLAKASRVVFQGGNLAGKTSLAKIIFGDTLRQGTNIPLFIQGEHLNTLAEDKIVDQIWKVFRDQYNPESLDEFRQLAVGKRTIIIDDWHKSPLNAAGRKEYLSHLGKYFGQIFLFTNELFQIHEIINSAPETILEFDSALFVEFGHKLRGQLIDQWVTLGREYTADARQIAQEIEEKERLVQDLIGKNTLPRLPFIVLFLLQADQENKAEAAEAGSFGYLYEVLVTVTLSHSKGPNAQLEKKYTFLSRLAYKMFKDETESLSLAKVKQTAQEYEQSHLITVNVEAMLADLEEAHVFVNIDGNYSFAYPHLFYYFIARYYRDNLDREVTLHSEIEHMANHVSSGFNDSILMFIIYFARDSSEIVKRLVANADAIYKGEQSADLDTDVEFLNKIFEHPAIELPEEINIEENRQKRREFADRIEQNAANMNDRDKPDIAYSDTLSDVDKFDFAYKYIGLLGQVIRNFPGSLPGPEKLLILQSAYSLGLRTLRALLGLLENTVGRFRTALADAIAEQDESVDSEEINNMVAALIALVSRLCALSVITKISNDVGVQDLESAYKQTLELVGRTNASQLVNLAISLNHLREFPITEIRELHKQFAKHPFSDTVLADLVVSRMSMIPMDRRIRQSIASLFKLSSNQTLLVEENILNS